MIKADYLLAVRQSLWRYAYVQITPGRQQAIRLSEAAAQDLVAQLDDDAEINAAWIDGHKTLIIGEGHGQI